MLARLPARFTVVGSVAAASVAAGCLLPDLAATVGGSFPSADGGLPTDASKDAGGDSSGDGGRTLLFADEFDGVALSPSWNVVRGSWSIVAGEAVQSDPKVNGFMFVNGFSGASAYEVIARMRTTGAPPVNDDAIEIAVRASATTALFCSFEPGDRFIRFIRVTPTGSTVFGDTPIPTGGSSTQPFTLHARLDVAAGTTTVHVWVEELPGSDAYATLGPSDLATGSFGLVTYNHSGAFDWIRVYATP